MVETGLVTAPVTPPGWSHQKMAKLARELVLLQKPEAEILTDFQLTEEEFQHLKEHDFFKRAFEQMMIEWNSATSVDQRLRIQALSALEMALPELYTRITDKDEALPGVVQAATLLTKLGGIGEKKEATAGEKFTITINLGADVQTLETEVTPTINVEAVPVLERPDDPESSVP